MPSEGLTAWHRHVFPGHHLRDRDPQCCPGPPQMSPWFPAVVDEAHPGHHLPDRDLQCCPGPPQMLPWFPAVVDEARLVAFQRSWLQPECMTSGGL